MTEGGAASVRLPVVWHGDQRDVVTPEAGMAKRTLISFDTI